MKIKNLLFNAVLTTFLFPVTLFAQSKWAENDDMYFSKKDREKVYASVQSLDQSNPATSQSEYTSLSSTSLVSPTTLVNGNPDDDNNQYFIKDYSIKNKTDNEVKTYSGINSSTGFQSGVNMALSFGSFYRPSYYGAYYNPYTDPFSPYYDPFFRYSSANYYSSYRYNPWRYNNYYGYGYNSSFNNGYYGNNVCINTNYSNNVHDEVRYRNGRKVISGNRNTGYVSQSRSSGVATSNRFIKNTSTSVKTNGRSSSKASRNSYRKYPNSVQNRSSYKSNSNANRVNTYNRSNNSNSNNWNNSSNFNRSNSYRSSGSSSGTRSSSFSSGASRSSSGSRSSGSSRSSAGKRGN